MKYPDPVEFQSQTTWLNLMYYGFGALNFCTPIISTALIFKSPEVSSWFYITDDLLLIFTVGVLFVALFIIKRSLKAESKVAVNVKAMTLHLVAFAMYAV
jgi:hypothetical protein